jgi:hypothetical protein
MAEVLPDTNQDFWHPPAAVIAPPTSLISVPSPAALMAEVCHGCGSEFMIAAHFCHTCGRRRGSLPSSAIAHSTAEPFEIQQLWTQTVELASDGILRAARAWRGYSFPSWLKYLHFHEIKRRVGLPTASLVAFLVGLGCVAGVIGVSLFFRATNLAEFQAIQMWRIEWLLGATASFVAGILLKDTSGGDSE